MKVDELTQLARDRERALDEQQVVIAKQQVLLDHDRDIRELMGARDLYIAEVHNVAGNRKRQTKPTSRVFYTKGKSLIFYAYDLDQETNLKSCQHLSRRGEVVASTSGEPSVWGFTTRTAQARSDGF